MRKKAFYGIFGRNGCGVYTDYSKACDAMAYLFESCVKRFDDFHDAQIYAVDGFISYNPEKILPAELPLNFTVYKKACADIM